MGWTLFLGRLKALCSQQLRVKVELLGNDKCAVLDPSSDGRPRIVKRTGTCRRALEVGLSVPQDCGFRRVAFFKEFRAERSLLSEDVDRALVSCYG